MWLDTMSMHLAFHDSERFDDTFPEETKEGWPALRFPGGEASTSLPFPKESSQPDSTADNADAPPIGREHLQALQQANTRAKKIKRAASVASFNGWLISIMAAITGLGAIFDWTSIPIALALAYVARQEFQGRTALRRIDPRAASRLGWNQIVFASLIIIYAGWGIYATVTAPVMSAQYAGYGAEVQVLMEPLDAVYTTATVVFYLGVAFFGVIFQGGTALYYYTRRKHLVQYLQDTPRWVNSLMMLRNQIVSKMGLKHLGKMADFSTNKPSNEYQVGDQLGIFSIYSLSHEEVILEDRDKHLDVRLSFFIEPNGDTATLHASSVVHVKNTFGKVYMFFVAPVHKLIVPATLKRLPLR